MTNSTDQELLPCPCCSGADLQNEPTYIMCNGCGLMIDRCDAPGNDFRAAWNKRQQPASVAVPEGWLYRLNPDSPNTIWQFTQCPDAAARFERSSNVEVVRIPAAPHPVSESAEARFEHYLQNAIDNAPDPLRRLGEYLSRVIDEDEWATAERMLNGAIVAASAPPVSGEQKPAAWWCRPDDYQDDGKGVRLFAYGTKEAATAYGDHYSHQGRSFSIIQLSSAPPAAQDVAEKVAAEWIEHGPSSPCPFTHPYSSKVDIRLRDGTEKLGELACNVTWFWYAHEHRDYHVVAYRPAANRAQQGEHPS